VVGKCLLKKMIRKGCSILIPSFKSNILILEDTIKDILKNWTNKNELEIIIIIDGGLSENDEFVIKLKEIKNRFSQIKLLLNLKRLGQQKSILNGFSVCSFDTIITIDDDYKYPLYDINSLYIQFKKNDLDCIIGKPKIESRSLVRKFGTKFVKKVFGFIYNNKIYFSSFRFLKTKIAKKILEKNHASPVIGYLILEETNKVGNFYYSHNQNNFVSRYKLFDLLNYFIQMNFYYTKLFYKLFLYLGGIVFVSTLIMMLYYLYIYFTSSSALPGFTTIVILILIFIQIFFFAIAILLKYLISILEILKKINTYNNKEYKDI